MKDHRLFVPPTISKQVVHPTPKPQRRLVAPKKEGKDFAAHLAEAQRLQVSHHAQQRLSQRQIPLSSETWGRVLRAVDRAAAKGSRDSLVLVEDLALVVNIPNRTVITAVNGPNMKERVFTNIDSAVIG
ncbi:MAG TPA: TIGR02530 family flagellar biosynthesis protein [bacterium]|jgi:flagellar operon protein|nr:TIGR02530 family flagellar biosynthesis protein [bacterium]